VKITIYAVGNLKEGYWREAQAEYLKRLSAFAQMSIVEFPDLSDKNRSSPLDEEKIKEEENKKILAKIAPNDFVIALDLHHEEEDSVAFSKRLMKYFEVGRSHLIFVIGGSLGISETLKRRANAFLTLSQLTFTHQMSRVILLEQLYRAFKIHNNQPYHK